MSFKLPNIRAAALGVALALVGSTALAQDNPAGRTIRERANRAIELDPSLPYNPYTLLVRYRADATPQERAAVRAQVGGIWLSKAPTVPDLEVISTQIEPSLAAQSLGHLPWIQYVEVDYTVHADVVPNDSGFGDLWGLHNIGQSGGVADADIDAPEAWDIFTGNSNTVVAIIDTGMQRSHPDLAANSWTNPNEVPNGVDDDNNGRIDDLYGWDFVNNDADPSDDHGHGTHCAGTIGAVGNNGIGVAGVNWNVKMLGLKFLSASGSGSSSNAVLAVDYCRRSGIKISSNSWGGGGFSQALYDAINLAGQGGHLFIAAAGNNGSNNDAAPFYPSSYNLDNLIAVASIDRFDARSGFSNYGLTSVDLGAPGSSILSTYPGSAYATMSGTSMACPHVSGAVALLWGYRPSWTRQQVKSTLFATVRPTAAMDGRTVTGGVVNVHAALLAAGGGGNTAPTVTISSPSGGSSVVQGTSVTFSGSADDSEDGNISASLTWSSSISGNIGSGASFSTSGLALGTHTVTATVTDSGGVAGSANVSITVTAPGPTVPNAPSNLTLTRLNPGVQGSWTDNSGNEDGFRIEGQQKVRNGWQSLGAFTVGANVATFTANPGSGQVRYRVQAYNSAGSSAWTPWENIKI